MKVRQLMSANPYCLSLESTVQQAAQEMKKHSIGAVPVCDRERLVGIITDRDIVIGCVAAGKQPDGCLVKDHMTADPVCISPESDIEDALGAMSREQVRRLCVTQDGRLVGLLALGDLAHHFGDDARISETLAQISEPIRATAPAR